MLMSNEDRDPVTNPPKNNKDNDSEFYESIRFSKYRAHLHDFIKEHSCFNINFNCLIMG